MLPLVIALSTLILVLCFVLVLAPCILIHCHKRFILKARGKNEDFQGAIQKVRFITGVSSDHSQATHDDKVCMNIYEPPAYINGSSMLYESVYLQTCFDETLVDDILTNVVTSHSYPISSSEQLTVLDDESCCIVHENMYAVQIDLKEVKLGHQCSLELGDSSARAWEVVQGQEVEFSQSRR
jgi:hypothetical protein